MRQLGILRRLGRVLLGVPFPVLLACDAPPPAERPPNLLVYMVDTLRADALEPYGAPPGRTPELARFAAGAVVFERAYAHSSWTRPSIVSVLSGWAPDRHGVESREDVVPEEMHLLAERLREAGYETAAVVTNPNAGRHFGFAQGFDHFVELFPDGATLIDRQRGDASEVNRHVVEWLDDADPPFFLFVLASDPHWPYSPPESFDRFASLPARGVRPRFRRPFRSYLGEVAYSDHAFGEVLDALRDRSLEADTWVVFTSDHGESFGDHGLLGHGRQLFDEVVRVPLLIRRPDEPSPGLRVGSVVGLRALFTTLLEAAGATPPDVPVPALPFETGAADRTVYGRLDLDGHRGEMLLDPPWKLIVPDPEARDMAGGLFRLDRDPRERRPVRGEDDRRASMGRRLAERAERPSTGSHAVPDEGERDLPEDVRRALEALGYLDAEGAPAPGAPDLP